MGAPLPSWEEWSLAKQVAQMVVVRASGYLFDHQIQYPQWEPTAEQLHHWIAELGVGGVILLGGSAAEVGLRSHQLQEWATIPLLIAADIEEGVGQRFSGATWFPPPMALRAIAVYDLPKAIALAETMGAITAQEALAIGINWVLAPVVDVNNNPQNPVINVRAFGETPEQVSQLTTAFIRGAQAHPVLTTAKHFPGHGDTAIDSHLELPVLTHTLERLKVLEFLPFQAAIAAGVDVVMTAHLRLLSIDVVYPATLSQPILTHLLRHQLHFDGLIVTDALVMGAIAKQYGATEAPVLAVEAGADIVLMPVDPAEAIDAICHAVETGRIARDRIADSVERIWRAKHKAAAPLSGGSSHAWEKIAPSPVQLAQLAQPLAIATVTDILQASMQLQGLVSPYLSQESRESLKSGESLESGTALKPAEPFRNLIVVDEVLNCTFLGRQAPAIALPQQRGYLLQLVDSHTPFSTLEAISTGEHPTLLQLFIRGNPFRGSANLTQIANAILHPLLEAHQLQALVIYGSPYVMEQLPQLPATLPFVFTYGQFATAQAIALQALFDQLQQNTSAPQSIDQQFTD